jgi:hypothetical protein
MARGGLVAMLYSKTTDLRASAIEPSASVILMSADIERITTGWERIHELWANLIEIALAIYLLQRQLGVACTVPVAVTICKSPLICYLRLLVLELRLFSLDVRWYRGLWSYRRPPGRMARGN